MNSALASIIPGLFRRAKPIPGSRNEQRRRLMQPLALAIFCGVFIALILVMGIMDLRRSDLTLQGFMENQGLSLVGVVERLAQENLNNMIQAHQRGGLETFVPVGDEAFLPHKWLTHALVEVGREIDGRWKAKKLSEEALREFAQEKNIWLIVLLNRKGQPVLQSRPKSALTLSDGTRIGERRLGMEQINRLSMEQKIGFLALQRRDGKGTVVIVLDREGSRYWIKRVAVEKALEKFGEGQGRGLIYLVLTDNQGSVLGKSGLNADPWENLERAEILTGKKKIQSRKVSLQGKNVLDLAVPLSLNNQIVGIARLGMELDSTEVILRENKRNLFMLMAFVVAVALLSVFFLYQFQNRHLAGIVEMERRLERAERLSALGQLAAGVAHEIRNPLNAISMASQRLRREFMPDQEEKRKDFDTFSGIIKDEIVRLNGIIEEFLSFSRSRRLELRMYPVEEVLQKIINLMGEEARVKGINVSTDWGNKSYPVPMDMDKLQQALLNIFKNAMESITQGGSIEVKIRPNGKDYVSVLISDTGCGMGPSEMEQIFSPDYTTKEKGLGLGLSLAHEIIQGHGGRINVASKPGVGTQFEVVLPTKKTNGKG